MLAIALFIKIRKKYHFSLSLKNKIFICGYTGTICIILSISQLYQNLINSYFCIHLPYCALYHQELY